MAQFQRHRHTVKSRRSKFATRLVFLLLLFIAVLTFLSTRDENSRFVGLKQSSDDIVAPVLHYTTLPIRGVENWFTGWRDRSQAHEQNKALRVELARMRDLEAREKALSLKLKRFESILNVDVSSGISVNPVAARAVYENNGPFVRSALINTGRNKGITRGHAVMTIDGLYGHIVRVGQRSARVLQITDLNSRIAVMSDRSEATAILIGDNSDFPTLSYVVDDAVTQERSFDVGDIVFTSGDDGIMPRGLPIGEVVRNKAGTLKVSPYFFKNTIDWVLIYPFSPILSPEENEGEEDISGDDTEGQTVQSPAEAGL